MLVRVCQRHAIVLTEPHVPAHPRHVPFDVRRPHSAPVLCVQNPLRIESRATASQIRDRAGPRTHGSPSRAHRSASQVPGNKALDRADQILTRGGHGLEKRRCAGLHVPMQPDLAILVKDADVHGPGVPIEATVTLMWRGVQSPEVSSAPGESFPVPAVPRWDAEEGASISIKWLESTPYSRPCAAASGRA